MKSSAFKPVGSFGKLCSRVGVDRPPSAAAWELGPALFAWLERGFETRGWMCKGCLVIRTSGAPVTPILR